MEKISAEKNAMRTPIYTQALAARLVGLSRSRVHDWLFGYKFTYQTKKHFVTSKKGPVIGREMDKVARYVTFLDLIDLLFIKQFIDQGVSLQKLRGAFREVQQLTSGKHFAHRSFFVDHKQLFFQAKEEDNSSILALQTGGQMAIGKIIKQISKEIVFDVETQLAKKWYPGKGAGRIVLDPKKSFGYPRLERSGIETNVIFDFYNAEGEDLEAVCDWFKIDPDEALVAVKYESSLN